MALKAWFVAVDDVFELPQIFFVLNHSSYGDGM